MILVDMSGPPTLPRSYFPILECSIGILVTAKPDGELTFSSAFEACQLDPRIFAA